MTFYVDLITRTLVFRFPVTTNFALKSVCVLGNSALILFLDKSVCTCPICTDTELPSVMVPMSTALTDSTQPPKPSETSKENSAYCVGMKFSQIWAQIIRKLSFQKKMNSQKK